MLWEQYLINLGYFGAFLSGLISSASLFLPTPGFVLVFIMAGFMNPLLVGILGGCGAAVGELTGYIVGYGAEKFVLNKKKWMQHWLDKLDYYFEKYHPMMIIFIFAATPLPFDLAGMACGAIKYPPWKFFIATLAGKLVKYLVIAYSGYYGITFIIYLFGV